MAMWRTPLLQTATNAAGTVVAAFASTGQFDLTTEVGRKEVNIALADIRDALFGPLEELAAKDDEARAAEGGSAAKPSTSRSRSTSGGGRSRGGPPSLEDAMSIALNFGAFKGETLGNVLGLSATEADEQYGYGDGERSGQDYIKWLSTDKNKNEFIRARARVIADAEGIAYE